MEDKYTCLEFRWENYAQLHLKISIVFFLVSNLVFAFVVRRTRKKGEDGFPNKPLFQTIGILFFQISVLVFLGYLYFDIHFPYFGTASDELPVWILAFIYF